MSFLVTLLIYYFRRGIKHKHYDYWLLTIWQKDLLAKWVGINVSRKCKPAVYGWSISSEFLHEVS